MADTGSPWNLPTYTVNDVSNGAAEVTALATQTHAKLTTVNTLASAGANPPEVHVYRTAALAIPVSGVYGVITWDTELKDTNNVFAVSNSRVPLPVTGKYSVAGSVGWPTMATTVLMVLNVRLNSAGSSVGGTSIMTLSQACPNATVNFVFPSFPLQGVAGDYVELFIKRSDAVANNIVTGLYATYLQLLKTSD